MRRVTFLVGSGLALILLLFFHARAASADKSPEAARGIAVGAPKAFDNRTLNLMLERLKNQLAGITVIDQKSLAQAIGTIQGSRSQDVSRSLTIQGLPTPSLQTTNGTSSTLTPPATIPTTTSTTSQTTTNPSATPAIPTLPDLNSAPSALTNLQYGMGASDLLSEQVDLTYQIMNLQMLLDRSLSDRLLNSDLSPRLQAVVGFNVTVDPPRDAENAVAVIEVTLQSADPSDTTTGSTDGPSLVAVMPQEHTYNSVALNSKSNAFGGSAVAKVVTVSYAERRRGQTYYLFRDNDTVSFEKQSEPNSGKITFGWAFRPVLGRKSVAPGSRQVFAVVSLPNTDGLLVDPKKISDEFAHLHVTVKTYWRKYDPATLTSANDDEIRPWAKVGHFLSLGTSLTYAPSGETTTKPYDLWIPLTSAYLSKLSPVIQSVTWRPVGSKGAVVAVKGQNLFQETQVAIGDKLLTGAQDGLRLISDQSMDITTDLSALSNGAAVLGRYGPATPLEQVPGNAFAKQGLAIYSATLSQPIGGYIEIALQPEFDRGQCLQIADLDDGTLGKPIVFVAGAPVPGPYQFPGRAGGGSCVDVVARVPETLLPKLAGIVTLKFPFRKDYSASFRAYDPNSVFKLQTLASGKDYILQRADGPFVRPDQGVITANNWRVLIGNDLPLTLRGDCPSSTSKDTNVFCLLTPNDYFARLSIGKQYACTDTTSATDETTHAPAKTVKPPNKSNAQSDPNPKPKSCPPKIIFLQEATGASGQLSWVGTYLLNVPGDQPDAAKPALDPNQSQAVNQHDEVWRSFTGTGLSGVGSVVISDSHLEINPAKDGKSIAILIPKWITKDPASVDLTFLDKQGGQIGTGQIVVKPSPTGGK